MSALLEPIIIGGKLSLRNRVVMGSMTRNRCIDDGKPGPAQVQHYVDRARDGAGLIVNEGTFVDWTGCDWSSSPFMITSEHSKAWQVVTDAVHEVGGKIFFHAWHAGRCQHDEMPIMKKHGGVVLAPSAVPAMDGKYRDLPGQPVSNVQPEHIIRPGQHLSMRIAGTHSQCLGNRRSQRRHCNVQTLI